MGLQYIRDVRQLDAKSAVVFDNLCRRRIPEERVAASAQYPRISARVHFLRRLEEILDDNRTVFKYNTRQSAFSLISMDFLLKNTLEGRNVFVFLAKNPDGTYFCRSFFPQEVRDYSVGQTVWTLLRKKKLVKSTGAETILYSKGM